jgi:hypothetical protein
MNKFKTDVEELIDLYEKDKNSDLNKYMDFLYPSFVENLKHLFKIKTQLILIIVIFIFTLNQEVKYISIFGLQFNFSNSTKLLFSVIFSYLLYQYSSIRLIKAHLMYIFRKVGEKLRKPEYKANLHFFSIPLDTGLFEEIYVKNYNKNNIVTKNLAWVLDILVHAFVLIILAVLIKLLSVSKGLDLWITLSSILIIVYFTIGIFINVKNSYV